MTSQDEETQKRLIAIFRGEARERLGVLSSGLIALEKAESPERQAELLDTLVREAHSLKGAARAVSLLNMEALARALERVLAALRQQEIAGSPPLFDDLHRAVDGGVRLLSSPDMEGAGEAETIRELTRALEHPFAPPAGKPEPPLPAPAEAPEPAAPPPPFAPSAETPEPAVPAAAAAPGPPRPVEAPLAAETVRIPSARLSGLMREAEQLLSAKLAEEHFVAELKAANRAVADWKKTLAKTPPPAPLLQPAAAPPLHNLLEVQTKHLKGLDARLGTLEKLAEHNLRSLNTSLAKLLGDIKSVLMLPAATLLELVPKMVRDLSRAQAKEVDLTVSGGEIAVDKRILDEMKDPLIHLVRNSIDHGIEPPAQRQAKGKPRLGRLTVSVKARDTDKVELTVADDGAGLDVASIRAAAVKRGLVAPAEANKLGEREVLALALRPGVTTSAIVTDLSGRGLGLAIVQEKVLKLNGTLDFDTGMDTGTTFRLVLPLTLTTFRGVVVQCAGQLFIAPTANVDQVLRSGRDAIRTVENRTTILAAGQVTSLVQLSDVLELRGRPAPESGADKLRILVVSAGDLRIAFLVDAIDGEQEVLVKPLGRQLTRVRNISGAALLGTGEIVPILNMQDLVASAVKWAAGGAPLPAAEVAPAKAPSLLVVEDSITTRTLLRNILEGAGYAVQTAVDGIDALTRLRKGPFDLVVSDVAMPRMDGFALTAGIREDQRLAELPVVLVTALESREDRERGIEVGANAYIVKSSFDQSNLLETIGRLL